MRVFIALHSGVYMYVQCVYGSNKVYMYMCCVPLLLFLYIMRLHLLSCYKAHNFITYKNNGNQPYLHVFLLKMLSKNRASGVGQKVLE